MEIRMKIMTSVFKLLLVPFTLLLPAIALAHEGEHQASILFNILHPLLGPEYMQIIANPLSLVAAAVALVCIAWAVVS
jgi:hypothetical protein